MYLHNLPRKFSHRVWKVCHLPVPLFAETFNKEVSNVLCEKPIILVELLFELRILVIQDSEDGKRTACKKCAAKIVNCYRMFAEYGKHWWVVGHSTKVKDL